MTVEWRDARLVRTTWWAPGLCSLHLEARVDPFRPGQFVQLGVERDGKLVKRAYSYASAPGEPPEFLVTEVEGGALSPSLCGLREGETLRITPRARGFFTLDEVPDARDLWMVATGTGIAPFVSMLRTDTPWERFERIVLVHGVRLAEQLAYRDELATRARDHGGRLVVVPFVTREDCAGAHRCRIPDALVDGRLESTAGLTLDPGTSQVMLCGNPAMIAQMSALLAERGMQRNTRRKPGHVTTERYW